MSLVLPHHDTSTRVSVGEVDPAQPLNTTSPLLRGLESAWVGIPSQGRKVYDIGPNNYYGVIPNNGIQWDNDAESTFPAISMPGDNSATVIGTVGPEDTRDGTGSITVFCLLKVPSSASVDKNRYDSLWHENDRDIVINSYSIYDQASGQTQFKIWDGSNENEVQGSDIRGEGLVSLCGRWDENAGMALFENGKKVDTNNFTGKPDDFAGSINSTKGGRSPILGGGDENHDRFEGLLFACYYFRRALKDKEIQSLSIDSRRGFPTLLNRRRSVVPLSGFGLATESVSQSHTLKQSGLSVDYTLVPEDYLHGHTLAQTSLGSVVVLKPQDVRHGHALEGTLLQVSYQLGSDSLSHAHRAEETSVQVAYALAPEGMSYGHAIEQMTLLLSRDAVVIDVDVRPKYQIDVSAEPKIK